MDEQGRELRTLEPFGSRQEAEAWLGGAWESLAREGASSVRLVNLDRPSGEEIVYDMRLTPT